MKKSSASTFLSILLFFVIAGSPDLPAPGYAGDKHQSFGLYRAFEPTPCIAGTDAVQSPSQKARQAVFRKTVIPTWMKWGWMLAAALLLLLLLAAVALNARLRKKTRQLEDEMHRHKATAEQARRNEKIMADIFNNLNDHLFFHDMDGHFKSVNAQAIKESGYSAQEWLQLNLRDLVPHKRRPEVDAYLARMKNRGTDRGYMQFITKRGHRLVIEYNNSLVYDQNGQPTGVRGIARNITETLNTRKALKQSEAKYRSILDSIEDGYYEVDLSGNIRFFNHSLLRIFGYTDAEIRGTNYRHVVAEPDRKTIFQTFNYVYRTGKPVKTFNWRLLRKDGGVRFVETSVSPNLDDDGNPSGFRGIVRDITKRRRAEQKHRELEAQLQHAQKMESLGTLAGGIAHDFNNILFPLIGYTEMAIEDLPENDTIRENLEQVLQSAERAKALVQQILTFSRQSREHVNEPVLIEPIVKETIKLLQNTVPATIAIETDIAAKAGRVMIHPAQVHQVIMNLCTNAVHAMENQSSGVLRVSVKTVHIAQKDKPVHPDLTPGPYVCISVADTGNGIEPGVVEKIFEPYFTTKPQEKGTGLGLSVSYGIVKNADGVIAVDSPAGEGARFDVYLPVAAESAPASEPAGHKGPLPTGREEVLLVDDEYRIVELEKQIIESLGYRVCPRTSSIEALEAFRHNPDRFDIVLTDQTMPNMTGMELARALLKIRADIPIILCTGYSEQVTPEKIENIGIATVMMKPISKKDIAFTLRQTIDKDLP
ncbi:MAG: PAS domain-containing hybrid sensor histidine kinase/response regulator [Thermodesulfobacteriota bacterium]